MHRVQQTIGELTYEVDAPVLRARDPVGRALDAMCRRPCEAVMVVDDGKVVGIFTSRDFLFRVAALHKNPEQTQLGEVMTVKPETLRPRDSVCYAIERMSVRGFRNIPIVTDDGRPLGLLSIWNVMQHLTDIFDEIERVPVPVDALTEISTVTWVDIGGGG
jgi:CBS domain-containing protein